MKLSELRTNVRRQTETLPDELPDSTIDWYLTQAFERQMAHENAWPLYEKTWELTLDVDASAILIPGDVNRPGIMSLRDVTSGYRLTMIDHSQADDWFGGVDPGATFPGYFSVWGDSLHLWPTMKFAMVRAFRLRGHRLPVDWVSLGPDAEPDCDPRLHGPLIHYAIALAYAQQEDETLETVYMQRWQMDFQAAANAIMQPSHQKPFAMASSISGGGRLGIPGFIVNVPGSI